MCIVIEITHLIMYNIQKRRKIMNKTISDASLKIILKMQQNELTESVIYEKIAKFAKGEENKKTLLRLAEEEKKHYEIWKSYTGVTMKPKRAKIAKFVFYAKVFGFTFAIKIMERGEKGAQKNYSTILEEVPEAETIKQQEEEHENALISMLDEERLKYVGSMVLGLNDALVELAGSLAGFTFALQNTRLIALSGLIVGISATFSMASSEFLSAKSEGRKDALKSCAYTGIAYLLTVALLVAPYLICAPGQYLLALVCMLGVIVLIIAGFNFYIAVVKGEKFAPRFFEMLFISVGVGVVSFVVGILAKHFIGV